MKRFVIAVKVALVLAWVPAVIVFVIGQVKSHERFSRIAYSGCYCGADGMGHTLRLFLMLDGSYRVQWHGCRNFGEEAKGRWRVARQSLFLDPEESVSSVQGLLVGSLRELWIAHHDGRGFLISQPMPCCRADAAGHKGKSFVWSVNCDEMGRAVCGSAGSRWLALLAVILISGLGLCLFLLGWGHDDASIWTREPTFIESLLEKWFARLRRRVGVWALTCYRALR